MLSYIRFNNLNSLKDLNLYIKSIDNIPMAQREKDFFSLANGKILTQNKDFQTMEININFIFADITDLNYKMFVYWITDIQDNKLFINEADKYYIVKDVKCTNFTKTADRAREVTLVFRVEPFKRYEIEETYSFTRNLELMNYENFKAYPYLKVYGTGLIKFKFNDEEITLKNMKDYFELDTELQECYRGRLPQNFNMSGDFANLTLNPGMNKLSCGNAKKIELLPRWRC